MRGKVSLLLGQLLIAAAFLSTWQVLVTTGKLDKFFFSRPSDIAGRIVMWLKTGSIWPHLLVTLEEAALAFAIGAGAGIVCGFALARSPRLGALADPFIRLLNALPRVVLAPIFLLWFGLGIWSKVALGVTVVFFIVFFNTHQGVRDVDKSVVDNARMLGASEWQLTRHVLIPSALTWVFSSLHISIGFAVIAVVVGEYLGSSRGVGYLISQAEGVFDTTGVFAGMAVLSASVLLVGLGVNRLERWLLRWKS
ncbi:MAG: ABC transporter permease [Bryobacteraceae bacterium]